MTFINSHYSFLLETPELGEDITEIDSGIISLILAEFTKKNQPVWQLGSQCDDRHLKKENWKLDNRYTFDKSKLMMDHVRGQLFRHWNHRDNL